jgi:acetyl-CoA acetyltransferase
VSAQIIGAAESPYCRHPREGVTTEWLLADAFVRGLADAGIQRDAVDGLGVASFTLKPDHAIDLAWRLGLRVHWLMDDANGGASGIQLLQHAVRAIDAGDASTIVLLSGDRLDRQSFRRLVDSYNSATAAHLAPIPTGGPNVLFALLTAEHMERHGLERSDYGRLVIQQRDVARLNPGAVYRLQMTMADYLGAPVVAPPLHRYDCVPIVSGADALVVSAATSGGVKVRALQGLHNVDGQEGDGLRTGLAEIAPALWNTAGAGPADMDAVYVYDDYPAMVLVQLADLGFIGDGDVRRFIHEDLGALAVNTSGGQLSAGQAGAAGGMHGLVEAVTQLRGRAGARQVERAHLAVVSGYGMVLYRYGACANAVVLEAP